MPLEHSGTKEAVKHNIEAEIAAGKPQKQAAAIALSMKERAGDVCPEAVNRMMGDSPALPALTPAEINARNKKYRQRDWPSE